jgi:hypothetical protein
MPSPYPLPKGCIFRERFENPLLAQRNGLVITGNPWLGAGVRGVRSTSSVLIQVPRLSSARPVAVTVLCDIDVAAFTGNYRTVLGIYKEDSTVTSVGFQDSVNRAFFNGTTLVSAPFTPGAGIFAWTSDGTTAAMFQNGVYLGGGASASKPQNGSGSCILLNSTLGSQYFGGVCREIILFNYALSADEISQYTRLLKGGLL